MGSVLPRRCLVIVIVLFLTSSAAIAQNAGMQGSVVDPSGAAMPGHRSLYPGMELDQQLPRTPLTILVAQRRHVHAND
jgi:hypothetical protein